ncbi:GSCOCG00011840001-RA-CDS, partial [Cotesia congregata]
LKVGKAAGPDLLPNEVYKSLTPHWKENLRCLYNNVLNEEQVPSPWAEALVTMLYKKGDKNDPKNYRGIALCNTIMKIFTTVLKKRLTMWTEMENILPECQM